MPFLRGSDLALVCTASLAVCTIVAKREEVRAAASSLCEALSRRPAIESDLSRDAFASTIVPPHTLVEGHTHAIAAGLRTSATHFAMNMAAYCGAGLFIVGMSKSDQRKQYRGTRQWFWTKDANADNQHDEPYPDDVRYLCDVDYYLDMNHFLAEETKPVVLYTMVPESAAQHKVDNTSYRFMEDGSLETVVAGGGRYQHWLWNYGMDSVMVVKYVFGVPYKTIAYSVERKQVAENRQLILLAPMREFIGLGAWLSLWLMETPVLRRFDPVIRTQDGVFVNFSVVKPDGAVLVTTSLAGSWLSSNVPAPQFEALRLAADLGSTKLMLPTSVSWVSDRTDGVVLTRFFRATTPGKTPMVYPVAQGVRSYQYNTNTYDADAKPKLEAFMSPLHHGAFVPIANKAGEEQCVQGRITSLRKPEPKPCRFRDACMIEFADLIVQGMTLEPVCYDSVAAKQTSASQRLSLYKATLTGWFRKKVLKCFIKAEAYSNVKDPRNISTYNDADKLDMAMFALALSEHCKKFNWYGPGKTPIEIADRVAEICMNADNANISDYHRMDGTITYVLRMVDRVVCMKAFANHRAKLNELLKTNCDNISYLPNGTTFDQGPTHGSGCSATSLFQTLRAAFTAYLAFRNQRDHTGKHYSPTQAFSSIGIHLGDDGLDANLSAASHGWAAKRTGLILETTIVQRGNRGVNFLARYYSPNVWYGDNNSMCDVKRQISKFHTTVRMPQNICPGQKLAEKAMSYVATDANTPVIGEFCKTVLLRSPFKPRSIPGIGNWWSKFEHSVQFPNANVDGWMDVEFETLFPEFDRSIFDAWLASTHTAEELLHPPICAEPEPAKSTSVAVVVDDDILSPTCSTPSEASASGSGKKRTRPRTKKCGKLHGTKREKRNKVSAD